MKHYIQYKGERIGMTNNYLWVNYHSSAFETFNDAVIGLEILKKVLEEIPNSFEFRITSY